MKKNMLFLVALLCLLSSFKKTPPHCIEASRISNKYISTVSSPNFKILGSGGLFMKQINGFIFAFTTIQQVDIVQARKIIIDKATNFLTIINSDQKVKKFLKTDPFEVEDLYISIGFLNSKGKNVTPPYIGFVNISKGKINYCYYDSESKNYDSSFYNETFEEALNIINNEY